MLSRSHLLQLARSSGSVLVKPLWSPSSVFPHQAAVYRYRSSTPVNLGILFVPQQEAWVVERMGKFHRILDPGLNFLVPVIDKIKYVQSLKEIAIDVPKQSAITSDNVTLSIDGVLYLRIINAYLASYGVEDPEFAITQLAQTTMRSELGKISLDKVFRERESLNISIVHSINKASEAWGITCLRYEIRDIKLPSRVHEAMQMQVEAERKKRAAILESEGIREAEINVAEGKKTARILGSEADRQEQINKAHGRANALQLVATALSNSTGRTAASLSVAEDYVKAFNKLAKTNNTLILPSDVGDISTLVGKAMAIYSTVSKTNFPPSPDDANITDTPAPIPIPELVYTPEQATRKTLADQPRKSSSDDEYYSDDEDRHIKPSNKTFDPKSSK